MSIMQCRHMSVMPYQVTGNTAICWTEGSGYISTESFISPLRGESGMSNHFPCHDVIIDFFYVIVLTFTIEVGQ